MSPAALRTAPASHRCGACDEVLFTARFRDTGMLVHVERHALQGDLELVPELFPSPMPHVVRVVGRWTALKEHRCAAYITRGPQRKRRP